MSYLDKLPIGGEEEEEMEMEAAILFNTPNDILIDLPTTTSLGVSCSVSDYVTLADPLADLDSHEDTLELQGPSALITYVPLPHQPEELIVSPEKCDQDKITFMSEMEKSINSIINESIQLINKDPRQYHPFYLQIHKYITIGQQEGHIPLGDKEALKIWEKYDGLAKNQWENYQNTPPTPLKYEGQHSSHTMYALTKKIYANGKPVLKEKRDEKERNKKFYQLERKAKEILRVAKDQLSSPSWDIKSDLWLRMKFFNECATINHPEDTIRMNRLWSQFCCDFGRLPLGDALQIKNPLKPSTKERITVKVQLKLPESRAVDNQNDAPFLLPSFSPPPSPYMEEEVEEKFQIPEEIIGTKEVFGETSAREPIQKGKKCDGTLGKKVGHSNATSGKKQKVLASTKKKEGSKKLQITKRKETFVKNISTKKCRMKKSELIKFRLSLARKKLKLGLKKVAASTPAKHEKVLSVLEKKISSITVKLKRNTLLPIKPIKPVTFDASEKEKPEVQLVRGTLKPEFSMCEECGQTYRTHYLNTHKEAVHNPNNIGKPCPLCNQFFKGGQYLWAHFMSTHVPDHLNTAKIADQVQAVVHHTKSPLKQEIATDPEKTDNNSWNCPHCENKPFATKATLQRHLHLVHGEGNLPESKLVCSECPKSFKEKAALTQHMKRAHQGLDNRCEVCSKRFQTPGKLWKHKVDIHDIISDLPGSSVQCEYCGENCVQGKQYINHVKRNHPEMLEDTLRQEKERRRNKSKELKKAARLRRKMNGYKESKGSKECPECGKILSGNLSRHLAAFHGMGDGTVKLYHCPKGNCDKRYKSRVSLRVHLSEIHDPVNERITEKGLIKIVERQEDIPRMYECSFCGWKVGNRHECMVHVVAAHPHCMKDETDTTGFSSVKCPNCDESGGTLDQMRHHIELFHPENLWRCPYPSCWKVILSPVDLQEHFYKNHGESNADKEKKPLRRKHRRKRRTGKIGPWPANKYNQGKSCKEFPCYRCDNVEATKEQLKLHVKETHPDTYFPCEECSGVYFTERSRLFHQSVLCKVKKQVVDKDGVVGFDQIVMECPICKSENLLSNVSKHLKVKHGVTEDGDLWKCEFCKDNEGKQNFRSRRDYWLAHMDNCHGAAINIAELIEVARKINTKKEIDLKTLSNKKKWGKRKVTSKTKIQKMRSISKKVTGPSKSRFGRTLKRRKSYSDESEVSEVEEVELNLDSDCPDDPEVKIAGKVILGRNPGQRRGRRIARRQAPSVVNSVDSEEMLSNLPLKIRTMFKNQCFVCVERLSKGQIEMYKRSEIKF